LLLETSAPAFGGADELEALHLQSVLNHFKGFFDRIFLTSSGVTP
jgi:hypothetical protein